MVLFLRARGLILERIGMITGAARDSMARCKYVILAWRLRWMFIQNASYTMPCAYRHVAKDRVSIAARIVDIRLKRGGRTPVTILSASSTLLPMPTNFSLSIMNIERCSVLSNAWSHSPTREHQMEQTATEAESEHE